MTFNDASAGAVVNQIKRDDDGIGRETGEWRQPLEVNTLDAGFREDHTCDDFKIHLTGTDGSGGSTDDKNLESRCLPLGARKKKEVKQ
jgi:hypothetical protein